jgi:glycyl-tRNA synthetase beta chain
MSLHTVLFELGCEELPPKSLKTLRDALLSEVTTRLASAGLPYAKINAYAAPRRLAILIECIAGHQPDRVEERRGPSVAGAFKPDGTPTPAVMGFAKGAGIEVSDLIHIPTDKGEWLVHRKTVTGQSLDDLLPALLQESLNALPIAKRMRSAASRTEFVRPVQWVVLMKDSALIPATIQDFASNNLTYGHRFHAPAAIALKSASDYLAALRAAYVVADFDERQQLIDGQVEKLATEVNARALVPADLRDEVTGLVEWPVALRATFESRFLHVPQEALISTMQDNQKYFCLVDANDKLQPYFITVSNIESKDPTQIILGNEKVVRPRLTDAEFFFKQDQKQPLAARQEKLANRVFQAQLGTIWDKTERIAVLASYIATQIGANVEHTIQAAKLSKCDLASEMVGEFPELQGIAGSYYAALEGAPKDVSEAIREQYLPKFSGDVLPETLTGVSIALADRLDTLAGIFGINQPPTGNKDPFGLRRVAIGILRILIEKRLTLSLIDLVEQAVTNYGARIENPAKTLTDANAFLQSRYRSMYEDQGMQVDVILAVQALNPVSPLDFDQRIRAVQHFRALPEATALAAANKRVANILAKETVSAGAIDSALLVEAAEKALYETLETLEPQVHPLLAKSDYTPALSQLAALRAPIDAFFESVMVNADDAALRLNRLRLLTRLRALFMSVADVSVLQG